MNLCQESNLSQGANKADRVAVVTGAGSGIGKAAAIALIQDGWTVALLGRRREPLVQVLEEVESDASAYPVLCDVSMPEKVEEAFKYVVGRSGRVDLLFNNAGVGNPPGPFEAWSPKQWRDVVDINLNGMFYCLQQAFRIMKEQLPHGGRIINNGSISASVPFCC